MSCIITILNRSVKTEVTGYARLTLSYARDVVLLVIATATTRRSVKMAAFAAAFSPGTSEDSQGTEVYLAV